MAEEHLTKQQFTKLFILYLLLLLPVDAAYLLIPTVWQSKFVVFASIIMMVNIFILTDAKLLSDKKRRIRLIWILFGVANLSVALAILQVASFLTSWVLIQYLKNKQIVL